MSSGHARRGGTVLSFTDLEVTFRTPSGPVAAVRGISLDVRAGEVMALVGESGAGKSVTSMAALSLLPRNARVSGRVRVGDTDLLGLGPRELRRLRGREVAMVSQEPATALNPVLTAGDQLVEAVELHGVAVGARAAERAARLLAEVGFTDPGRRLRLYPHELSGGQRQRVAIALAMAGDPRVLVADEPTAALDVTVQAEILDLLRSLKDARGTGILLVSHDMGVVADLADRVAVMRRGEIVETGSVDRVLRRPAHEYTRALLAAVPRLGSGPRRLVAATDDATGRGTGRGTVGPGAVGPGAVGPGTVRPGTARAACPSGGPRPETASGAPPVLDVRELVVEYRRLGSPPVRAVDGVTLAVGRGEVVGVVGESGAGKSTVVRCVLGLLPATSGSVAVSGRDLTRLRRRPLKAARGRIGVVFQDPAASLDPRLLVGESVAEPLAVHGTRDAAVRRARVAELLDAVELPRAAAGRYPHELSGGQRQRVSIARALVLRPDLLVADEPTSALDVSVQAGVLALVGDLQERYGFGCLLVSHDLAVVDLMADRVVVLRDGTVVEQGDRAQVLHHPHAEHTRRLVAAAPVPDPVEQRRRREARFALLGRRGADPAP